jgi:WD40 repeat protein
MLVVGDHVGIVTSIAFFPDGRRIAWATKEGTVRIASVSGEAPVVFPDQTGAVLSVAASADGNWIATGHATNRLQVWRPDGTLERSLGPLESPVNSVAFVFGGEYVAAAIGNRLSATEPGELRIWRISDWEEIACLRETNGAWILAATPIAKVLAWGNGARRITTWQLTAQDRHVLPALKKPASALAISRDGELIAANDDWSIRVWDVRRSEELMTLPGHKGRVTALAFTPDGRQLISGGGDQRVITWDLESRRESHSADWNVGRVTALAISPDGMLCSAAGDRGRVVVWDRE